MKITYTENPLRTTIELDEHEQKELWYKVKCEELRDLMFSAHFHLEEKHGYFDVERAKQELDPKYYFSQKDDTGKGDTKSQLDQRVDELTAMYINDLLDIHCGDCTCIPCSCSKCHAEATLGIDTMPGLRKHEASKIGHLFDRYDKDEQKWHVGVRNIHEAIAHLEDDVKNFDERIKKKPDTWPNQMDYEYHIPRWKQEGINALEWLKNYRDTHFPLDRPVDPNKEQPENTRV